ncbi:Cyclopropane-fatty-acyl-phospholipid synthase [Zea mays]|uniref:Cyclopropane-fatty-acyl-phospholipid synthase n=1 Tax=Zea mays TaxID=4577 RepID=A0A1D6KPI6_MAIZE|nr:Cyclopropane-fatty-acyl-phospholipid synthase [Zea mays]
MAEVTPPADGQPASWSEIPRDLAGMVLCLLPAYADRARFAAVCPQWRAAARLLAPSLPPALPLLALPNGIFYSLPYSKPCRFPGSGCVGYKGAAFGSWLVFPRDEGCFLVDPFAGATVTLPALSSVRLRPPNAADNYVKYQERATPNGRHYVTWLDIRDSKHGKLYALADDENLLVVDISQDQSTGDPHVCRIGQVIKGDPDHLFDAWMPDDTTGRKKLYLVESCGALLMVRRKVCCRMVDDTVVAGRICEFEVLEADLEHSQWVDVTTLGDDQMLFLGRPCSRAVSASQYGMSNDQIFFLDDVMENAEEYAFDEENTSVNVYDMRNDEVSRPLQMVWKHEMFLATWMFPRS